MKDLPKVYANPINKKFDVQKEYYESKNELRSSKDINKKINEIFSSINHVYKSNVFIKYNNYQENVTIIGKTNNYLLTLDNRKIDINNIIDIERI